MPPDVSLEELSAYEFELPRSLIAQSPAEPRDHSRLMVLDRLSGRTEHRRFYEIIDYLGEDDLMVLNDTRVLPCRLRGRRTTGAMVEVLLIREVEDGSWEGFLKSRGRVGAGETIELEDGAIRALVRSRHPGGRWTFELESSARVPEVLDEVGRAPLPPYIRRSLAEDEMLRDYDLQRYQTVFAEKPGSVAAPTAGLHFTPELLDRIRAKGVRTSMLTLHVGPGTFLPIKTSRIADHQLEAEHFTFSKECADAIAETRRRGGRVIAVGTTCCRVLETVAASGGIPPMSGWTSLYIKPPHKFSLVDALLTNFHLPHSTLLVMVCAFAGREEIFRAYQEAMALGYRFYSYGDAMLIY